MGIFFRSVLHALCAAMTLYCVKRNVKMGGNLRRNGLQTSTVLSAFVIDQAQFAEEDRQHAQVLLQLPQSVLMCVRMVRDPVR